MKISVPISLGELLDKISILHIKRNKIRDATKILFINDEINLLMRFISKDMQPFIRRLECINEKLWKVEDDIRKMEKIKSFSGSFIILARSVYRLNDKRFAIKNEINERFKSDIREQKEYEKYT